MKLSILKAVLMIFTVGFFFSISTETTFSHAVFSTYTLLRVEENELGESIEENRMEGYSSINSYDAALLLGFEENPLEVYLRIEEERDFIEDYLNDSLRVINQDDRCTVSSSLLDIEDEDTFIITGLEFDVEVICNEELADFSVSNRAFANVIDHMANYVIIFRGEEEILLDIVFYSAFETVSVERVDGVLVLREDVGRARLRSSGQEESSMAQRDVQMNRLLFRVSDLLKEASPMAIIGVLFLIAIIGGLHSLEGGHDKILLATMMINDEINLKESFTFIIIFTLTHMADIIVLSIGLLVFQRYSNIYERLPFIQEYAVYLLIAVSLYIVIKEYTKLVKSKTEESLKGASSEDSVNEKSKDESTKNLFKEDNYKSSEKEVVTKEVKNNDSALKKMSRAFRGSLREQFIVAFVSGLAPCITGWKIFILIVSTGALWLLIPSVIAFGLGVLIVLLLFALLINKLRDTIYSRFEKFSRYASLASGLLLLLTSILLLI